MRVLFVDDDPLVLQALRRLLFSRRNQWDMSFASGGRQALAMLSDEVFDVVVTDMRMPEVDGVQVLTEVRRRHPRTTRIVLSGQVDPPAAERIAEIAHRWLHKPCEPADLVAAIAAEPGGEAA